MLYEPNDEGEVPIVVQPPCEPDKAQTVGYAPENFRLFQVWGRLPPWAQDTIDIKLIRGKKRGTRWSVVT